MTLARLACIAALPLIALPAPVAACDLDGQPGFGGFHRMNPFADAYRRYQAEDRFPQPEVTQEKSTKNSDKKAKDKKPKQGSGRGSEPLPVRDWERDIGNGGISEDQMAADKAIII
ncbi:MAG: hypothetical protein AAF127_01375 [Pseudomonadota bacterium]